MSRRRVGRPFDPSKRPSQQAVRVGRFEATLDAFNREQGAKVAETLTQYHEAFVKPIEDMAESAWSKVDHLSSDMEKAQYEIRRLRERIERLERPWWRRLIDR